MAANVENVLREKCKVYVQVGKDDFKRLTSEVKDIKEVIPKILTSDLLDSYSKLEASQEELQQVHSENHKLRTELDYLQQEHQRQIGEAEKRYNNLIGDYDRGREEKFDLKCQLADVNQQLIDQSDYCASLGASVCTLLWRVSRQQQSVSTLLEGAKAEEFLHLTRKTIISYFATWGEDDPQEKSEELEFVLALCGIITNIAAAPCGREFFTRKEIGQVLVDCLVTTLEKTSVQHNVKIRSLMLMALYNISINFRGLQYLISKPSLLPLMLRLIQEESDSEIKLNAARLLQSIVMEPECLSHEHLQQLSLNTLQKLVNTTKGEVQYTLQEIIDDVKKYPINLV
ncbi:heat shock factor 2-binding protein-like isoform X2 [Actinia tenebrosa]|uniref:Heat shock factor 2-binding protein-like isoform X2 n=1 Tax=Actinia tenebrosa TaxID=6105 RepID=A0A6P8HLU2_ACTTE|nr:heat shock factor 2-binding protein-like isoform X2 [Actinia tenebrosa]